MSNPPNLKEAMKQALQELGEQYSYPPEIHFARHRLPPSGWEYIGPDDHLQVNVFTTAATTGLTLALRSLDAKGNVHYQIENIDTSTLNTVVTTRFKMAEGWLIGATASNIGGGLADQACFVVLALQRSFKSGTAPHTILQQGYVTNVISVSWPPVFARGPAPPISTGAWTLLGNTVLAAPAASVTFSGIPQTFSHLMLYAVGVTTDAALFGVLGARFNGDAGANYDAQGLSGSNAAVSAFANAAQTQAQVGSLPGTTASANTASGPQAIIEGYARTTQFKNMRAHTERFSTIGTVATYLTQQISNLWRNTAGITSIQLFDNTGGNLGTNSEFWLYAIP